MVVSSSVVYTQSRIYRQRSWQQIRRHDGNGYFCAFIALSTGFYGESWFTSRRRLNSHSCPPKRTNPSHFRQFYINIVFSNWCRHARAPLRKPCLAVGNGCRWSSIQDDYFFWERLLGVDPMPRIVDWASPKEHPKGSPCCSLFSVQSVRVQASPSHLMPHCGSRSPYCHGLRIAQYSSTKPSR